MASEYQWSTAKRVSKLAMADHVGQDAKEMFAEALFGATFGWLGSQA